MLNIRNQGLKLTITDLKTKTICKDVFFRTCFRKQPLKVTFLFLLYTRQFSVKTTHVWRRYFWLIIFCIYSSKICKRFFVKESEICRCSCHFSISKNCVVYTLRTYVEFLRMNMFNYSWDSTQKNVFLEGFKRYYFASMPLHKT